MANNIITISREFGSGGRLIGEKLAISLGVPFYDKAIIQMAAEKSGLSPKFIEQSEESIPSSFLFNLASTTYSNFKYIAQYDTPVNDKTFFSQAAVLREIASRGDCVIVGRCADYVLRDEPGLVKIFIRADMEDKIRRAAEDYDLASENVPDKIKKIDKARANYYKYYTGEPWGSIKDQDLVVNTSYTGADGAVEVIKTMLANKIK